MILYFYFSAFFSITFTKQFRTPEVKDANGELYRAPGTPTDEELERMAAEQQALEDAADDEEDDD